MLFFMPSLSPLGYQYFVPARLINEGRMQKQTGARVLCQLEPAFVISERKTFKYFAGPYCV